MNTVFQVPVAYIEKDGKILLVQEKTGHWSFCGGAMEPEDKNLEAALARELEEELSLTKGQYAIQEKLLEHAFLYDDPRSKRFGSKGIMSVFKVKLIDNFHVTHEINTADWIPIKIAKEKISDQEKPVLAKITTQEIGKTK